MKNIKAFYKMKNNGEPIAMVTAYDYPSGKFVQESGIDIILVGDSLGMVVLGYENTLNVTLDDMIHHTKAVKRGAKDTFVVADMPYSTYHLDLDTTKKNAMKLIVETSANAVKLEGGTKSRIDAIKAIIDCEIPVVAHLGLTPQSINKFGGYSVQGKSNKSFDEILKQAVEIEKAGAFMLVLEGIPEKLGKEITQTLKIPTIGIGAGRYTDGQVLVYHDILGMSDFYPKFVKKYENLSQKTVQAVTSFIDDVKNKKFPLEQNVYNPIKETE